MKLRNVVLFCAVAPGSVGAADHGSGSGRTTLVFAAPTAVAGRPAAKLDFAAGVILATEASAMVRVADSSLPLPSS